MLTYSEGVLRTATSHKHVCARGTDFTWLCESSGHLALLGLGAWFAMNKGHHFRQPTSPHILISAFPRIGDSAKITTSGLWTGRCQLVGCSRRCFRRRTRTDPSRQFRLVCAPIRKMAHGDLHDQLTLCSRTAEERPADNINSKDQTLASISTPRKRSCVRMLLLSVGRRQQSRVTP